MTTLLRLGLRLMRDAVGARTVVAMFALQVVVALTEGLALVLLVPVVQALGGADRLRLPGIGLHLSLPIAFGLVVVVVIARGLAQWRAAVLALDIRLRTVDGIRLGLLDDLYRTQWTYLAGQRRSVVVQRLTTEVERAHNALTMLVRLVVGALVLAMTVAAGLVIAPAAGALATAALLLVALAARSSIGGATRLGRTMTEQMADFGATLTDSLAAVRVMRAHDAPAAWSRLVRAEAERVREVRRAFVRVTSGVVAALGVAAVVAVLVLVLGGRAAGLGTPELAALAVVATRLLTAAQGLVVAAQAFGNDAPALERLRDFDADIRAHPERSPLRTEDAGPAAAPSASVALVSLRGVTVRYPGESRPALAEVDLDVPRRGLVGVLGPSGAGKSTLVDVLLGLLPTDAGRLEVDGGPLADLTRWRSRLGYVPQQTVLVPGTIWENLAWSLQPGRELEEEGAWSALRDACLEDVVAGLPAGLHAPLGEVAGLSGGEQQRLMIARALVREPELLVLDEATAALDEATEARVLDRLTARPHAIVMVTHRVAPLARAGALLRLERGRVVGRRADPDDVLDRSNPVG